MKLIDESEKNNQEMQELKEALIQVWNGIEIPVWKKSFDSVPNRINEVIKMKSYLKNCFV